MAESLEKTLKGILATIVAAVIIWGMSTQVYLLNRMSVLENNVQTNSTAVANINHKIDALIESNNKMTNESTKLVEQLKYLEKDKK